MNWSEQLYNYCERGTDPAFWAEPLNAVSNLAFIIAAGGAATLLAKKPRHERSYTLWALVVMVGVIGVGSFTFHTFATRWARLGDIIPIGLFMLLYMMFALRHYLDLSRLRIITGLAVFLLALAGAGSLKCGSGAAPCLNGSLAYLPALLGLLGIAVQVRRRAAIGTDRRHVGNFLLASGIIFALSLSLRTIDISQCGRPNLAGQGSGTHFLWHLLNGLMLFLLLRAAIVTRSNVTAGAGSG